MKEKNTIKNGTRKINYARSKASKAMWDREIQKSLEEVLQRDMKLLVEDALLLEKEDTAEPIVRTEEERLKSAIRKIRLSIAHDKDMKKEEVQRFEKLLKDIDVSKEIDMNNPANKRLLFVCERYLKVQESELMMKTASKSLKRKEAIQKARPNRVKESSSSEDKTPLNIGLSPDILMEHAENITQEKNEGAPLQDMYRFGRD